jgi:DNA-binding MarR family transcriptional regulator
MAVPVEAREDPRRGAGDEPRDAVSDPATQAWAAITELFMSSANHQRYHAACTALAVPPPALKALLSLEPGEAKPMRTLAADWQCDASWVTSLIDILEARGLVERRILPTDRRVKTIVLTPPGVEAKSKALEMLKVAPEAMTALSDDEQRHLRDLLMKLVDATKAAPQAAP